jgi:hypothetical protein
MEGNIKDSIRFFSVAGIFALILVVSSSIQSQARSSVKIEENVSATSNTGGNAIEGGGEIKTENASASSSSKTTVKGGGETKIDVKTEAEANGKKVEAEVHEENPGENISIQKKIEENGSVTETNIDISNQESNEAEIVEDAQNVAGETNLFARAAERASEVVKNIFERIISIFG